MKSLAVEALRSGLRMVRRNSDRPAIRALRAVAQELLRATYNASYDFETNGEMHAIGRVLAQAKKPATVFDVGANVGDWSRHVAGLLGTAGSVHAFEPTAASFARLVAKTDGHAQIRAHHFGLSDRDAMLDMDVSAGRSQKSAVTTSDARRATADIDDYRIESCRFVRGDAFCAEHGIAWIDFLKIDTEGHDFAVLKGFGAMLAQGQIGAIQFEYNRLNASMRTLLRDFYDLLDSPEAGYAIGRVYPNSVEFKAYDHLDENFIDGNFLAVRRDAQALVESLARRG
jgi:FkbM family methyltransferase